MQRLAGEVDRVGRCRGWGGNPARVHHLVAGHGESEGEGDVRVLWGVASCVMRGKGGLRLGIERLHLLQQDIEGETDAWNWLEGRHRLGNLVVRQLLRLQPLLVLLSQILLETLLLPIGVQNKLPPHPNTEKLQITFGI